MQVTSQSFNYELSPPQNNSENDKVKSYKYSKFKNVISYKYQPCSPLINITINDNITQIIDENETTQYYYIFDCPGENAFAHWVYESFIFFDYFLEIRNLYPKIKILTSCKSRFINSFFKLFSIDNEIVYNIDTPNNNVCFFSPVISLNDRNIDQLLFKSQIQLFINEIKNIIHNGVNDIEVYDKPLFLPRNTKENYVNNDRKVNGSAEIEEHIIKHSGTVLNTYQINNLKIQFEIINSFKTVILDFGSSFFVNCIFLNNKNIICINSNDVKYYFTDFPALRIIYEFISNNNNNITFVDPLNNYNAIKEIIVDV
jgi:hypothetical protein